MRESFRWEIPLVILPVDVFTGNVVRSPALEVSVKGAERPLLKPEGFRVFRAKSGIGCQSAKSEGEKEIAVTLQGGCYQNMQVSVDPSRIDGTNPVIEIGVMPDRDYPFPPGAVYIEGMLPEHKVLWVTKMDGADALRLCADARMGDVQLHIYQQRVQSYFGHSFLLMEQGKEEWEWITCEAAGDIEHGIYRIITPIYRDYTKNAAKLYRTIQYESDVLGRNCFLALPGEPEREMTICCHLSSDHIFKVKGGETLQMDFTQM